MTPDQGSERNAAAARMAAGVGAEQIFVETIAVDRVNSGLDKVADDFHTLLRYMQVPQTDEGNRWREHLPLTVLRVRYSGTTSASRPDPYPIPEYDVRTANSEVDLGAT